MNTTGTILTVPTQSLQRALRALPKAMRVRVIVPAMKRSGSILARAINARVPRGKERFRQRMTPMGKWKRVGMVHYKDVIASKVAEFPNSGNVAAISGPESRRAPHAHLVEFGTVKRHTNSKPQYKRVAVSVKQKLKNGKVVHQSVRKRVSIGSKVKKAGLPQLNRGIMPARKPITDAQAATTSEIVARLSQDIAAGIAREFTEAKLARGVT